MSERYLLVGDGLVAHTLAAFWPRPLIWHPPIVAPTLPERPLLIYPQHRWLIESLTLEHHAITELELLHERLGPIHRWHSMDFKMPVFGWLIAPSQLREALAQKAQTEATAPHTHRLIATGSQIPHDVPYQEYPGIRFSTEVSPSPTAAPHQLSCVWGSGRLRASLPHLSGANGGHQVHTGLYDGAHYAYHRAPLATNDMLLGESLLKLPPTLASGYNTTLTLLRSFKDSLSWDDFKKNALALARRQFQLSHTYHRSFTCRPAQHTMLAAFKSHTLMRWVIQQVLYVP